MAHMTSFMDSDECTENSHQYSTILIRKTWQKSAMEFKSTENIYQVDTDISSWHWYSRRIFKLRNVVMSHKSNVCYVFASKSYIDVARVLWLHACGISWMQRLQTWKKHWLHVASLTIQKWSIALDPAYSACMLRVVVKPDQDSGLNIIDDMCPVVWETVPVLLQTYKVGHLHEKFTIQIILGSYHLQKH